MYNYELFFLFSLRAANIRPTNGGDDGGISLVSV